MRWVLASELSVRPDGHDLLAFGFVVLRHFFHRVAEIFFARHVVPAEHAVRFPTAYHLGNVFADSAPNHLPRRASTKVVE